MLSCRLVNHSILPNINLYSMEVTPWETIDSKRAYPAPDGGLFRWEPKNPNSQPDMMYYFLPFITFIIIKSLIELQSIIHSITTGGDKMYYLMLWETNDTLFPLNPEERMKVIMSMGENVKKTVESGDLKLWGISAGGGHGFAVSEQEPTQMFARAMNFYPYIKFKITPMLSIDEMINTMKSMQK